MNNILKYRTFAGEELTEEVIKDAVEKWHRLDKLTNEKGEMLSKFPDLINTDSMHDAVYPTILETNAILASNKLLSMLFLRPNYTRLMMFATMSCISSPEDAMKMLAEAL